MGRFDQGKPAARPKMHGRALLSGPSGAGKALRNDQPVLTPDGWVPIGALSQGDHVYGVDGEPCTVTGVYPQGIRPLFEVTFSDGVVVVADASHRWLTQTIHERAAERPGSVRTTAEIAATLRNDRGRVTHYVPMAAPPQHHEADLPIDPYVLGALLGDGGMSGRGVTISCPDDEVIEAVRKVFDLHHTSGDPIGWQVIGGPQALRPLGLCGKRSDEKVIPAAYMLAAPGQRHALLQGLLDTDGHASGHTCEWSTTSRVMCDQFIELVQSLGGTVTVSDRMPTYTYKGERRTGRRAWRCYVGLPADVNPFRLTRKAMAYTPRSKYPPRRQIVDVRPAGEGLATCISVDAPDHLFLTAGHVPTHNTWTALGIARVLTNGDLTRCMYVDTEKESALTYADVFPGFVHVPWRPPFDPGELTQELSKVTPDQWSVIVVDSGSHFWRGQGGTLDIADGKIGGWKVARPVQEALVQAWLSVPAHLVVCLRSKMDYLIENGGRTVTKLGLAPIQDDTLVYDFNIALDLDQQHVITVTKSRTPAVPVGRMYPAGMEAKCATDYAEWLAGGIPPANRDDVERIVAMFGDVVDADVRKQVKADFVEQFGMPHSLTAEAVPQALAWLEESLHSPADEA